MRHALYALIIMILTDVAQGEETRVKLNRHEANAVMHRVVGHTLYDTSFVKAYYKLKEGLRYYRIET